MRHTIRRAAVVLSLALSGAAVLPGGVSPAAWARPAAPAAPAQTDPGEFYAVPDPLPPGEPGDIIKVEEVAAPDLHGTLHRVMYHSRSLAGADIAVTGIIAVPDAPAPADGYPVVSWAHGTTGLADVCAPSKNLADASLVQFGNRLLDAGYLAVGTDFEGLGTPGRHPYIVGQSEARGVIDIVRAARNLPDAHASDDWLVWGHSQGGHAALWAGEIAPEWAPELDLVGTVAGAPPSHLDLVYQALRGSPFRYYIFMAGVGIAAAYPEADLTQVATELALSKIDVMDTGCTGEIDAAFRADDLDDLIKVDPYTVPAWKALIDAQEPGTVRTDTPILIVHGGNDEQIPVVSSELLRDRMCGLGQVVERRVYPGQSHAGVIGPSFDPMLAWIGDRFAGRAAPDDCDGTDPVTVPPAPPAVPRPGAPTFTG